MTSQVNPWAVSAQARYSNPDECMKEMDLECTVLLIIWFGLEGAMEIHHNHTSKPIYILIIPKEIYLWKRITRK